MTLDKVIGRLSGFNSIPNCCFSKPMSPSYFILGSGRSGNTLLRRLLIEQYDTYIPPEMPGLGRCMRSLVQARNKGWEYNSRVFFKNFERYSNISISNPDNGEVYNLWLELNLSTDELIAQALQIPPSERCQSALINLLYAQILTASQFPHTQRTVIGDKTPWNVMYTRQIESFFPDAKFVFIVRHPMAVALSYANSLSKVNGITLEDAAIRWATAQRNCLDLMNRVGKSRVLITKYDDLVSSENESHKIGQFLHLHARKQRNKSASITSSDSKLVQHKRINQPVDTNSVDKWRIDMDQETQVRLMKYVDRQVARLAQETGIDFRDQP